MNKDNTSISKSRCYPFGNDLEILLPLKKVCMFHPIATPGLPTLVTHYQPIVNCVTSEIIGFEGLTRATTEHCLLGPDVFIPAILEADLSGEMDLHVLDRVKRDINALGTRFADTIFFVNVFRSSLGDPRLRENLCHQTLTMQGARVCLEISEQGEALTDFQTLCDLRRHGTLMAFDDYDPRYFSDAAVSQIAPEFLKIRWDVYLGPDHAEICQAISTLDRHNTQIIVEGIETAAQCEAVRRAGFQLVQGFHYHPPMPFESLCALSDTAIR